MFFLNILGRGVWDPTCHWPKCLSGRTVTGAGWVGRRAPARRGAAGQRACGLAPTTGAGRRGWLRGSPQWTADVAGVG